MSALDVIIRAKRGLHDLAVREAAFAPKGKKIERQGIATRAAHELLRLEMEARQG